jgi:aldehyde:ferredoxin oxidoreductase
MTEEEFMRCGERIWNLSRLFNDREGFRREDDNLAPRIFNEPLLSGRAAGKCVPKSAFDASLRELYALRRWDADGKPLPEALEELGIDAPLLAQLRGDVQ